MALSKQQRAARSKAITQAVKYAMRLHFTGDGASSRILRFVLDVLLVFAGSTAMLLCVASWAVVGGLLAGPQHEFFLAQFHGWMGNTPLDQVLMQSRSVFVDVLIECVKAAFIFGLGRTLYKLVAPAAEEAKQQFSESSEN